MKKKIYITPLIRIVSLAESAFVAASLHYDDEHTANTGGNTGVEDGDYGDGLVKGHGSTVWDDMW